MTTSRASRRFQAMGCRSSVVVESDAGDAERLAELAMLRIARLEAAWSRFLPESDISRINAAGGAAVAVRGVTVTLLQAMAEAARVTDGAYDPTVVCPAAPSDAPCRWLERVSIDADACVVRADGVQLDPGGLGKGLGADLVVEAAVAGDAGARSLVQASVLAGTGAGQKRTPRRSSSGAKRCSAVSTGQGLASSPSAATVRWRATNRGAAGAAVVATKWHERRDMNDQVWWYLARAAGMLAAILMVGALVLGVLAATRALKEIDRPAWLVALHRWFRVLTVIAVATHLLALVADSYLHFGLVELLVPFTSSWRPLAVSLGVVGLYLFAVVHISSLAMKRLSKVWWRRLHTLSYLSVWAAIMHAGTAGTDTANAVYRAVALVLTMLAVLAALLRVILGRYASRAASSRAGGRAAAKQPMGV